MKYAVVKEDGDHELEIAWGVASGTILDPSEVRRARGEEIEYVRNIDLYEKVLVKQCYDKIERAPISTRLVDISKGDKDCPNYRSRFVARELNTHKRGDLFVAAPPLEALKLILPMTTTSNRGG